MNKREVAAHLLGKGSVFIHLDPRKPDVLCPLWLKSRPQLVLQIGLNLPIPIPDLLINAQGISGTLSFSGTLFECYCPWDAIFALSGDDRRGATWPDSMPEEVLLAVEQEEFGVARMAAQARPKVASDSRVTGYRSTTRSGKALPKGWRIIK